MSIPHGPGDQRDGDEMEEHDSVDVGEEVSETLAAAVPWAISVMFHAAIVLLTIFVVWTTATKQLSEEVVIPVSYLSKNPGSTIRPHGPQRERPTEQQTSAANSSGLFGARTTGAKDDGSDGRSKGGRKFDGDRIGVGGTRGEGGDGIVNGPMMSTTGGKGRLFGDGKSGGGGKYSEYFGTGGNAERVVYLIDASGSLIDSMPLVMMELKRSIMALTPEHKFTVIFFQGSEPKEVGVGIKGLKHATDENKKQICAWIDTDTGNVIPGGLSNPDKALRLALSYRPELIYVLSDNITGQGRYEVDQRQLLREIALANRSNTKINAIQYLRPDPLTRQGMTGTMEMIAKQSGGLFRYVGGRELNIQ